MLAHEKMNLVATTASIPLHCPLGVLMPDIVQEFVAEALDNVSLLERALERLDSNLGSQEGITEAYRAVHTIRGASGFLGLPKVEELTSNSELLLGRIQSGSVAADAEVVSALRAVAAALHRLLDRIAATGGENDVDDAAVNQELFNLAGPDADRGAG